MEIHEFARQMPKVQLHVHLEGAIQPATLLKLAERNHITLPAQDEAGLLAYYHYRDFAHFIDVYMMIIGCLRNLDDYHLIAYEFGRECARQNIRYSEVTFTIMANQQTTGLAWQDILAALNQGRAQAHAKFVVDWSWVFDIVRNLPETQTAVLETTLAAHEQGVVALGLGGSEADFPPELFIETFEKALQAGLPRVPHAGETAGPQSVWAAVKKLHADRIGHGVRCIEDPELVAYLRQERIPLEVCPTSNIRLGVYPSYSAHPLRRLWDAGLVITVNSDDPPMFGTDLNQEYLALVDHFGFDADELAQVSLNAVRASLLPAADKARLEAEFKAEFQRLRDQ